MAQGTGTRLRAALMAGSMLVGLAGPAALAQETTRYTYDALGRLTSAIDSSGKKVVYAYDNAGNRTRLSNGTEFAELIPVAFSASSNAGTSGLATSGAMRDGQFGALGSIHVTQDEAGAWIMADLGQVKAVNHIELAPALALPLKAGPEDLNGALIQYSVDGTTWREAGVVSGAALATLRTISIGGVELRYLRLKRLSGALALGDLRLYASAAPAGAPLIAEPDAVTSTGSAVTFDPRANDRDLDGHPISIVSVETPLHGQAVINGGTAITYTPDAGYFGPDSFVYAIADGHDATASARVSVTVRSAANHSPVAIADSFSVHDRPTATISGLNDLRPLDNDYDADGDVLAITALSAPAHGQAQVIGSNLVRYQPDVGYLGTDTFSYTLSDGRGGTASATITVNAANAAPIAGADSFTVQQGASAVLVPIGNDSDPNGDPISITALTTPSKGTAVLNPDQTVTYTPAANAIGADSFAYTLADARGAETQGSIAATITTPPTTGQLRVMTPQTYGVFSSISGNTFTVPASSGSQMSRVNTYLDLPISSGKVYWEVQLLCGQFFAGVANDLTARGNGGYSGYNAGQYSANHIAWIPGTNVNSGFSAAMANDVYGFALDADGKTLKIYKNNVLGPTLSLPFSGPYYAHVGANAGTPVAGQTCATQDVKGEFLYSRTKYSPPSGYDQPRASEPSPIFAVDDLVYAFAGNARTFDPRGNDLNGGNRPLTIVRADQPNYGTAAIISGDRIRYNPPLGFVGEDSFSYTISEGVRTSSAVVRVVVGSGPPIFTIDPPVLGKATWDLNNDGPLNLGAAGVWTLTPQYTFFTETKVWGAGGGTACCGNSEGGGGGFASGLVRLEAGRSYSLYVGGGGAYSPMGANGGLNGGGHSGNSANTYRGAGGGGYSGIRLSSGASVIIAGGGGGDAWGGNGGGGGGTRPEAGVTDMAAGGTPFGGQSLQGGNGVEGTQGNFGGGGGGGYVGGGGGRSMSDRIRGGGGAGGSGYFDPIRVSAASLVTARGSTPANEEDPDRAGAGAPAVTNSLSGAAGRLLIGANRGAPPHRDDAPYVQPPNLPPQTSNDILRVVINQPKTIDVRLNDWDPEGDLLEVINATQPTHGSVTLADGLITYTPTTSYVGHDTFSYQVKDPGGAVATARVEVRVGAGYAFTISPPFEGKSTWDLDADGPLNMGYAGTWTITPHTSFTIPVKAWGGPGGAACCSGGGGGGGFAGGEVTFSAGTTYSLHVGGPGTFKPSGANGGLNGGGNATPNSTSGVSGGGGGGYSGVRTGAGSAVLIAGGGGGQGWGGAGGGGGGTTAQAGGAFGESNGGLPGAGPAYQGIAATGYGGAGGGGYLGGGRGQSGEQGGGGGGGGTGYFDPAVTANALLVAAVGQAPANASDPDRGGAGQPDKSLGTSGRLILLRGTNH